MDMALKIILILLIAANSFRLGQSYESSKNSYEDSDNKSKDTERKKYANVLQNSIVRSNFAMSYENLSSEELDRLLIEKISGLSTEKHGYLLEWLKTEFSDNEE